MTPSSLCEWISWSTGPRCVIIHCHDSFVGKPVMAAVSVPSQQLAVNPVRPGREQPQR